MPRYLLSAFSADGEAREPMTDEQMQYSWQEINALEAEMKSAGAWVFSGRLHDADTATVVRVSNGDVLTTLNGIDVSSPEKALEAYSKIKDSTLIDIGIVRAGKPVSLEIAVK